MLEQPPILKDEALNNHLMSEGYVVIPFIEKEAISELRTLFYKYHHSADVSKLFVSSMHTSNSQMEAINHSIKEKFNPSLEKYFQHVDYLGGTFIAKAPDSTNVLHPHQDWNIVDETKYRSYTIWVALQDVNDKNGSMYVLAKSHNLVRGYRHITIPSVYGKIYDVVWKKMRPVHLKAGEAIVFDHALAHASLANNSNELRIAATHSIVSKGAELRFYWNNNGIVEEYQGERSYYIQEAAKIGPSHLQKIRDLDFKMYQFENEEFEQIFSSQISFFHRLKNRIFNK